MLLKNRELAIFSEAIAILHFPLSAAASCAKRPLPVPPPPYALQIWCRQRTHARSIPVLSSPNMCAPAATIPMPGPPPLPARCRNVLKLVLVFGAVLSQLSLLDKWGVEDDDRPPAHRALQHRHRFQRQLKKKRQAKMKAMEEEAAQPPAIGEAAPAAFPATTAGPVATADEVHVALGMANERTLIQAAWAARVEADSRRLAP